MEQETSDFQTKRLSLCEWSTIAVASYLLELPDVKQEVKSVVGYINCYAKLKVALEPHVGKKLRDLKRIVSEQINHLDLPKTLEMKVRTQMFEMCDKMLYQVLHLAHDLDLNLDCIERFFWTPSGDIDLDKIFQSMEIKFSFETFYGTNQFQQKFYLLHIYACFFVQEEFLTNFGLEIIENIKSIYPSFVCDDNYDAAYNALHMFILCFHLYKLYNFIYGSNILERQIIGLMNLPAAEKLKLFVSYGLQNVFFYFWNHLSADEQHGFLENISESDVRLICKAKYGKENFFHIVLFLLNKMNPLQQDNFIQKHFSWIIVMCLKKKHFQKFCFPLLNKLLLQNCHNNLEWERFLLDFVSGLRFAIANQLDYNLHIRVFKFLLERMPVQNKHDLFSTRYQILQNLFDLFCIPILNLIINDTDCQEQRDDLISQGKTKYKNLIKEDNFEVLNKFMNEVLTSENEKNYFKNDFNFLSEWAAQCRFKVIDSVLIWIHGESAHEFKIQSCHLWCSLVPIGDSEVTKLLKWYFNKAKKPFFNNYEDESVLYEFGRELIYNVWFRSRDISVTEAIRLSELILSAFFGSENRKLKFKRKELVKLFREKVLIYYNDQSEARFDRVGQFVTFTMGL